MRELRVAREGKRRLALFFTPGLKRHQRAKGTAVNDDMIVFRVMRYRRHLEQSFCRMNHRPRGSGRD